MSAPTAPATTSPPPAERRANGEALLQEALAALRRADDRAAMAALAEAVCQLWPLARVEPWQREPK